MRFHARLLAAFLIGLIGACGEYCDCGPGGQVFVQLSAVEPGGSVEVCYEGSCERSDISDVDGSADEAEVLLSQLGGLEGDLEEAPQVEVRVFDADGAESLEGVVVPQPAENCCGRFWTVRL